jgi:GT2 family glycosyltransferase
VDIGIVVPTLGERPEYLNSALRSIRAAGDAFIVLVSPKPIPSVDSLIDSWVQDPKVGLSGAVNAGEAAMPESVKFFNWLGDDDMIIPGSLERLREVLLANPKSSFAFGSSEYIDSEGKVFWLNKSGSWATWTLRFGPNRIPQPGALIRRSAFHAVGGLNTALGWAMDLDLFLNLLRVGRGQFVGQVVSRYRWHADSLSAGQIEKSVRESAIVRYSHAPRILRWISIIWEKTQTSVALRLGSSLNRKSRV